MAGFGATIRAGAGAIAVTAIAAFFGRFASELVPFLKASPAVQEPGTREGVTRTIEFVELATGNVLLIFLLSVSVFFLVRSYLNSEVRV